MLGARPQTAGDFCVYRRRRDGETWRRQGTGSSSQLGMLIKKRKSVGKGKVGQELQHLRYSP